MVKNRGEMLQICASALCVDFCADEHTHTHLPKHTNTHIHTHLAIGHVALKVGAGDGTLHFRRVKEVAVLVDLGRV